MQCGRGWEISELNKSMDGQNIVWTQSVEKQLKKQQHNQNDSGKATIQQRLNYNDTR